MTLTAFILIVASACLHAIWNLLSKATRPSPIFFFLMALIDAGLLLPVIIMDFQGVREILGYLWPLLVLTGFFQALYYTSLAYSYQKNDMSLAYPLIRAVPVLLIPVGSAILKLGENMTSMAMLGIVLVFTGCVMMPIKSFRTWNIKNYIHLTMFWIIPAALGTAGYTLVDGFSMNSINADRLSLPISLVYGALLHIAIVPWMGISVTIMRDWKSIRSYKGRKLLVPIFAAFGVGSAYLLILAAMKHVSNIGYVAGFRQLSIPIGVLLGIVLLKEKIFLPRVLGTLILSVGLVFTAIY